MSIQQLLFPDVWLSCERPTHTCVSWYRNTRHIEIVEVLHKCTSYASSGYRFLWRLCHICRTHDHFWNTSDPRKLKQSLFIYKITKLNKPVYLQIYHFQQKIFVTQLKLTESPNAHLSEVKPVTMCTLIKLMYTMRNVGPDKNVISTKVLKDGCIWCCW